MSTPRSIALPQGVRRVVDDRTGLVTLRRTGGGLGTVLLAPGFTGSKEDFLDLFEPLAPWNVVAVDHRGQNESPWADEYSLQSWADDLCALAADLQPPVHLVGHSLGGLIAGVAACGFQWGSVTLLNSGSGPIHQSQHDRLRLLIQVLDNFELEQIWDAKTQSERARGWEPPSAEVEEFMRKRFIATDPACTAEMARILLQGPEQDLSGAQGQVLIAFGIEDPDSWSWQTQVDLAARWRARLAVIPRAAHSPAVEAPAATATLLAAAFLRSDTDRGVDPPANGYSPGMQVVEPLEDDTSAIRRARKMIGDQLWAWGLGRLIEDAELITSELVTNALRHGRHPLELRLTALPDRVRITVLDANADAVPERVGDRGLLEGGRGLALVEQLCIDWGHDVVPDGKQVWAELAA